MHVGRSEYVLPVLPWKWGYKYQNNFDKHPNVGFLHDELILVDSVEIASNGDLLEYV